MILVKSGNTLVDWFFTFEELVANFVPKFGEYQDFDYINTKTNTFISWTEVTKAKRAVAQ